METFWFIFDGDGRLWLTADGTVPCCAEPPVALDAGKTVHRLPDLDGHPCRAVRVEMLPEGSALKAVGLRASYDVLPRELYLMAGKGQELVHWDANTRYCGVCGAPMQMHTDISKRCTRCGKEVWPLLSTAIIVAVTRGEDEILLVQSNKFKADYLGLVAGFVETGETLEDCVRREVKEETNIDIKNVTYFRSQPWPYPCGLMVGFKAEYAGGTFRLQRSELNKGGWYRRDAMPAIPGKLSLARQLIDDWLGE